MAGEGIPRAFADRRLELKPFFDDHDTLRDGPEISSRLAVMTVAPAAPLLLRIAQTAVARVCCLLAVFWSCWLVYTLRPTEHHASVPPKMLPEYAAKERLSSEKRSKFVTARMLT